MASDAIAVYSQSLKSTENRSPTTRKSWKVRCVFGMPKLLALTPQQVIRIFERYGFILRQSPALLPSILGTM